MIAEGRGVQCELERVLREEVLGVKEMDGAAVDADPYGAVGIGEEGSLVGVVGLSIAGYLGDLKNIFIQLSPRVHAHCLKKHEVNLSLG